MIKPYSFDGGLLTGAVVTQGTVVPALTTRIIKAASITNTTAAAIAATVHLVPSGAASAANMIISARPIAPGETYPCPELSGQGMNAAGFLQALGNGLTFKYTALDFV